MQAEYAGAIAMFVDESRVFIDQNIHYAIVIHKTACGAPCTAQEQGVFFQTNAAKHSVHFVIGKDGTIVQCVLLKDGAGGNCCVETGYDQFWRPFVVTGQNLNTLTISIEHCDYSTDNSDEVTSAQKASSFALVKWLCDKYDIPPNRIKTHASIDPISRAHCPGNYPFDELVAFIASGGSTGGTVSGVPNNWHDDGKTLVAPNGGHVVLGFREHILNTEWPATREPVEPEVHRSPLLESAPQDGDGQMQTFVDESNGDDVILGYTPSRGVFEVNAGRELMHIRADRDNLKTLLDQANAQIAQLKQGLPISDMKNTIEALNKLSAELQMYTV